jgi:hypothetical protein
VLLAMLAVGGLLIVAARELARVRRRARRRRLLTVPGESEASEPAASDHPDAANPDDDAVEELRERPRPVRPDEAARILGVVPETLASLNIPVTRAPDGQVAYDS